MKSEKQFYSKIRAKVTLEEPNFVWPKEDIWLGIEAKKHKQKKRFFFAVAASLLLFLSAGLLLFFNAEEVVLSQKNKKVNSLKKEEVFNENKVQIQIFEQKKIAVKQAVTTQNITSKIEVESSDSIQIIKDLTVDIDRGIYRNKLIVSKVTPIKTSILEAANTKDLPQILAQRSNEIDVKSERVGKRIVLIIPEKNSADKKRFVGRLAVQIGNFNTKGKFEWEAVNIKPQQLWAYLKESVKTEPDSTLRR